MIHFTFDDNNTSDIWAAGILKRYDLVGAFFLNDKPGLGYDIESLLNLGMVVGNHTAKHTNLAGKSDAEILEAVGYFNDKLKSYGASGEYFSFPFSSGPAENPVLTSRFKYIYRGYTDERPNQHGEISRVTVTNKPWETVLGYTHPLQLHGIDAGDDIKTAITREQFIELCEIRSQQRT